MAYYLGRKVIRKVPGMVIKASPLPKPALIEGFGKRDQTGAICREAGAASVLLVTDRNLFRLGLHEKAENSLKEAGIRCSVFHEIDSEPTVAVVEAGKKAAVECGADCIVALGGGSVLDSSKIIAAAARHPAMPLQHYLHKFAIAEGGTLPMITIPSTAGTGAEWTVGAVVKNSHGVKFSTVVMGLQITHVILDSELTIHSPDSVTIWCGVDTLSHGLEGLMADVKSTDEDIRMSRECVRLVFENLPLLLREPENIEARQAMLLAAHYGGNAINTQLAGYVHAFAHSIGGKYHIPHGKAIAWCLTPVMAAQEHLCAVQMAELARHCALAREDDDEGKAADNMLLAIRQLMRTCGLEEGCPLIREEDFSDLTQLITQDSVNYSPPVVFSDNEIHMLLNQIRRGF